MQIAPLRNLSNAHASLYIYIYEIAKRENF